MEIATRGHDVGLYERYIRNVHATAELRRAGHDHEDVQAECRIAAWRAIQAFRARPGAEPRSIDELKFVRRSIKNCFLSAIRSARATSRCPEKVGYGTIQSAFFGTHLSGAFSHAPEVTETPEESLARDRREAGLHRAAAEIRRAVGPQGYGLLHGRGRGESWASLGGDVAQADGARALQVARRVVLGRTLESMVEGHVATDERTVESLADDDLARVALVHQRPIQDFQRTQLLQIVNAINANPETGAADAFPPCFSDAKEFDPNHEACGKECDFRIECAACIPERRVAAIENALTMIKARAKPPTIAKVSPPKIKPNGDHGFTPFGTGVLTAAVAPDVNKNGASVNKVAKPVNKTAKPVSKAIPPKVAKVVTLDESGNAKVTEEKMAPQSAVKPPKKATPKPTHLKVVPPPKKATKVAAPAKATPPKVVKPPAKKAAPKKVEAEASATQELQGFYLSTRARTKAKGEYKKNARGERYYRLPQGSAAYMRALPVGTVVEREYGGHTYKAKKMVDGVVSESTGKKLDGLWQLMTKDGKKQASDQQTLSQLTFEIVGGNQWSAAKFWNLQFPELVIGSAKFDPNALKGKDLSTFGEPKKGKKK